jgi:ribosomal protein L11 methyltransferase
MDNRRMSRNSGIADATIAARLATDAAGARRLAAILGETLDPTDTAVATFEQANGRWGVTLYFRRRPRQREIRDLVALAAGTEAGKALTFETLRERDWVRASLAGLVAVTAGRFVVHGSHDRGRTAPNVIGIEIDAGSAFGTGHHGTTRGCLLALDRVVKRCKKTPTRFTASSWPRTDLLLAGGGKKTARRARVLDLGSGSGILAIAAAKALRVFVLASDIDARAVRTGHDNARRNGVGVQIEFARAAGVNAFRLRRRAPFNLVFANILLAPLQRLAHPVSQLLAPGARLVLSGLLAKQKQAALAPYLAHGIRLERTIALDGWVTLVLRRSNHQSAHSRASGNPVAQGFLF